MNLHKQILTNNACYKAGVKMKPKGLMLHSTGANNPKLSRYITPDDGLLGPNVGGQHFNQDSPAGRHVCPHAFIGKLKDGSIATYQTLPWDMRGWHSGAGPKGQANDGYIGIEICEDDLKDPEYFAKVYREAVELFAYLCRMYTLSPDKPGIICHSEGHALGIASNHADVMHWFPKHGKSMDTFRANVKALLNERDETKEKPPTVAQTYRVRKTWQDADSQKGAFNSLGNAKACADDNPGYSVYDNRGNRVYTSAAKQPAAAKPAFTISRTLRVTAKVNRDEINFRAGPGLTKTILRKLPMGTQITVIKPQGDWTLASIGGLQGYIWSKYIKRDAYTRGDDIKALQKALKAAGYDPGDIDGIYGLKTLAAVLAFQRAKKLTADGVVGEKTALALGGAWK